MEKNVPTVSVIGAGLAGCEAAWQLANRGYPVKLYEMKPQKYSPAHTYPGFAELVCSNSLKAERLGSAAGLLKHEMARLNSVVVRCAKETAVAAGGALAVDRYKFSDAVTALVKSHPNITVVSEEVTEIPQDGYVIGMDAQKAGEASVLLGAGRATKEDSIDLSVGLVLHKKVGDRVEMGGLLGSAPVMPVHDKSSELFIARGGRIPAPLQSLKN